MILLRKMLRTVWHYKAQFLSMIIMIALGVGVYTGFDMEWYSLKTDGESFMESTHYADYRIFDEGGMSKGDLKRIEETDGIKAASRFLAVSADIEGTDARAAVVVTENPDVSDFLLLEGKAYPREGENSESDNTYSGGDGIWLSDKFAKANGIAIGDPMTFSFRSVKLTGTVAGFIKSSEYMICVADSNQLMPDFASFGYAYVTPEAMEEALGTAYYPQINILSDLTADEMESVAEDVFGSSALVVPKEDTTSFAALRGEIEEGQAVCAILPGLFLLIALLTMITTMHRITTNEKLQIGTLKALGFRDRKISLHYTSFAFAIGLIGSSLGLLVGFWLARMIVNPVTMQGTYFDFPDWAIVLRPFNWAVLALILIMLSLIGYLSVFSMLKGTAAEALRPHVPKKMKAVFLERFRLWDRFRFGTQWNLRDIIRHKARSLMTFVGIVGCMLLLVAAFGMRDTLSEFLRLLTEVQINYKTEIILKEDAGLTPKERLEILEDNSLFQMLSSDDGEETAAITGESLSLLFSSLFDQTSSQYGEYFADRETIDALKEQYDADAVSAMSVKLDGDTISMEIYDINHDMIRFFDKNSNIVNLGDDGVYICQRLVDKGYREGGEITVSPYGSDECYTLRIAGVLQSMITENIVMTKAYADRAGIDYAFTSLYTDTEAKEIAPSDLISGTQSKKAIVDSYDSFTDVLFSMIILMVAAAVVLGVVVLYNLGVMSYIERYSELATLKVVGFRDRHIAKLLISQNLWLTVLGIAIGVPGGVGVLALVLKMLAAEYELSLHLGIFTYLGSIVLTFFVSMLVSFFVARKNRKIDMVESLKGVD